MKKWFVYVGTGTGIIGLLLIVVMIGAYIVYGIVQEEFLEGRD